MKPITVAETFELKGLKSQALDSFKEILVQDSHNIEAKRGINRILGIRDRFENSNEDMVKKFVSLKSEQDFLEFERWLSKLWI